MSPKPQTQDRRLILENFDAEYKQEDTIDSPVSFRINPKGKVISISKSSQQLLEEEWKFSLKPGDGCFDLVPTNFLSGFLDILNTLLISKIPGSLKISSDGSFHMIFLTPVFSVSGIFENIQVIISPETTGISQNNFSAEREQEFINKLIKSLGKANDIKFGLSKMIRHISKFQNFQFAEAWEVGYDKNTLFKSAAFSKETIAWDDEGRKVFKKGEGLPGLTWKTAKLQIWDNLQEEPRFLRKQPVKRNNLSIGIGVPIIHETEVIAVLTFFGSTPRDLDQILAVLERISLQVSTYVKRRITEDQLNNMFRFSPNLIAVVGLDGYLKKVNPSFIRIFGFTEEKLLNTPFSDFLHKDDKFSTGERLNEVASGLSPRSFQNRCLTSEGEYKWITWTPSEVMEEEGIVHIFGLDISNIKNTNLELIKYKNIVESSKDGISLYTLDTGQVFFNQAFKDILGYSMDDLKGEETIDKIYANKELAIQVIKTMLKGEFWEGDIQLKDHTGKLLDYYFSGGPILNENEEIIAVFGLHTDISERKKYESALKDYGTRINNILESITDGFFSLNTSGEVTYWNKAAEDLLQIPRNKILNKKLLNVFPKDRDPVFYRKFRQAQKSNKKVSFEHFVPFLDLWFEVNVYPGKDGLSSYFKDISDRKRIEERIRIAQERYELLSKATREAVYDWDIKHNSLDWSDSYYEIYGYERLPIQESLTQWEQQIHHEDRKRVIGKLKEAMSNRDSEWICEYKLIQANRKIAVVLERGYIIRDEKRKAIRMIGSLQDITTLKQNERALEELNFQLKKHSSELLRSNAELEQFAYIASHDLQEPLRMVTSFLTLLEKKYEDQLDERAKQYIHFATDGAIRMRQIIIDLLDYSRVGKLVYDLDLIDLNAMITEITQLYEGLILEKSAIIEFKDLPVIKAAPTPLQRVLSNLISNSIKYSRENIPPVVKISVTDIGSHWHFSIYDNGIGFDEQFKEKIFIIFQRLHSRDEYSGTGIGLAICKKIVENHGGKIWVSSAEGVGSTFHFTIQKHF